MQLEFGVTSFSPTGNTLDAILTLLGDRDGIGVAGGPSVGLSRADKFGILIQTLEQPTKANLLSTPSVTTLDNQPAEIIVGQNVPFRTGSFTSDGTTQNTIERGEAGITMRVIPRVNQGDVVQPDITQEVSSIAAAQVAGAAELVTSRRRIKTTVLADNGGTIVLGGLITDDRHTQRSEVPELGKLPLVGGVFRSTQELRKKRTLFVFLRPTILRTRGDIAAVSGNPFQRLKAIEANPDDTRSLRWRSTGCIEGFRDAASGGGGALGGGRRVACACIPDRAPGRAGSGRRAHRGAKSDRQQV